MNLLDRTVSVHEQVSACLGAYLLVENHLTNTDNKEQRSFYGRQKITDLGSVKRLNQSIEELGETAGKPEIQFLCEIRNRIRKFDHFELKAELIESCEFVISRAKSRSWLDHVGLPDQNGKNTKKQNIYLVRHGAAEGNDQGILLGRRSSANLTIKGKRQAKKTGAFLRRLSRRRSAQSKLLIVASPIKRSLETANVICQELGQKSQFDDRFAEMDFGDFSNLPYCEMNEKLRKQYLAWKENMFVTRTPGGEALCELHSRCLCALAEWLKRANEANSDLIVITHKLPIGSIIGHIAKTDMAEVDNCSVTHLRWQADNIEIVRPNYTNCLAHA